MVVDIKQTLEKKFNIFLTSQAIRSINITQLSGITSKEGVVEGNTNLKQIMSNDMRTLILGSEDLSSEICLKLLTKEEIGMGEVFLISGVEGFGSVFSSLAPKLKSPATCLQLGLDASRQNSISDIAETLLPVMNLN